MRTNIAIFLLGAILLNACGAVTPVSIPETPTPKLSTKTSIPSPTTTPTRVAIPWGTSTPETLPGYPTPLMPVETDAFAPNVPVEQRSLTINELYIGRYVLRNWCKTEKAIWSYCAITISAMGEEQVEIWGFPAYVGPETGTDLTGNGDPDIVVVSEYGNGAVKVIVFEAGSTLKKIMEVVSHKPVRFADLNNDRSYEYIATLRIWSQFSYCQAGGIPVIFEYDPESSYTNQTGKYKDVLSPNIQWGLDHLASYKREHPNNEMRLCEVYYLVTAYLVSGQREKAWELLDKNYPAKTAAEYKTGFLTDLGNLVP